MGTSFFRSRTIASTVLATLNAVELVRHGRYFESERGYQGSFCTALARELTAAKIIGAGLIPEEEYQKTLSRHGLRLRPDIIVHTPTPPTSSRVQRGNLAVYSLKLNASEAEAIDDFGKLDGMLTQLRYALGFFININGANNYIEAYDGLFRSSIHSISVIPDESGLAIKHGYFLGARDHTDIIHSHEAQSK